MANLSKAKPLLTWSDEPVVSAVATAVAGSNAHDALAELPPRALLPISPVTQIDRCGGASW